MQSFETDQPIVLSIELSQGAVHVIASDRTDTVVAVRPSDRDRPDDVEAAEQTAVDLANGILSIRAPKHGDIAAPLLGWKRGGSIGVTVELPEGSTLRAARRLRRLPMRWPSRAVEVKTGAGDVRLDQTGALRVRSGAGQVAVEDASGRAEIVAAGDMTIGAVAGDADVKNLNGRTWIGRVGGNVRVKSANGDVTIEDAGSDVTVKTANGDIRLGQVARGSVTVETASGGAGDRDQGGHGGLDRRHHQVRAGRQRPHPGRRPRTVNRDGPGPRPDLVRRRPDRTLAGSESARRQMRPWTNATSTPSRCGTSRRDTRECRCSTTSRSPSSRARSSPCSGRTARARRPRSTS